MSFQRKFHQFELWREAKPINEAFHNAECFCLQQNDELALYDEANEEIGELESKLDLIPKPESFWRMNLLGEKSFEEGWDESENSSEISEVEEHGDAHDGISEDKSRDVSDNSEPNMDESNSNEAEEARDLEYDGLISFEMRDKLFE